MHFYHVQQQAVSSGDNFALEIQEINHLHLFSLVFLHVQLIILWKTLDFLMIVLCNPLLELRTQLTNFQQCAWSPLKVRGKEAIHILTKL